MKLEKAAYDASSSFVVVVVVFPLLRLSLPAFIQYSGPQGYEKEFQQLELLSGSFFFFFLHT